MTDVRVTPSYLERLAGLQDQAASAFGSAAGAASGLGQNVLLTHGVVCNACHNAVTEAEAAHAKAATALQKASTALAAWLRSAANAYESTDQDTADNLNKQVTSG